jgi:hypothetical protein
MFLQDILGILERNLAVNKSSARGSPKARRSEVGPVKTSGPALPFPYPAAKLNYSYPYSYVARFTANHPYEIRD